MTFSGRGSQKAERESCTRRCAWDSASEATRAIEGTTEEFKVLVCGVFRATTRNRLGHIARPLHPMNIISTSAPMTNAPTTTDTSTSRMVTSPSWPAPIALPFHRPPAAPGADHRDTFYFGSTIRVPPRATQAESKRANAKKQACLLPTLPRGIGCEATHKPFFASRSSPL
jgi:hypothetical protein